RSTVTVEANGQTRTFKNREGIVFPSNVGGKRSFTSDQIEFIGYGLYAPQAGHNDYAGHDVKGKVAVFVGSSPPKGVDARQYGRAMFSRGRAAIDERGAVATIGPVFAGRRGGGQQQTGAGQGQAQAQGQAQGQGQAQAAQSEAQALGGRPGGGGVAVQVPDGD